MKIIDTFFTSITALNLNKVRTFLTMLGVIIGVFAVVSLVSLVRGIQNYVTDQFSSLGSNLIIVAPGQANVGGDPSRAFTNNKLDYKHIELIEQYAMENIAAVTPSIRTLKNVKYKSNAYYATITGRNEQIDEIAEITIDEGKFFTEKDVRNHTRVVILGSEVADKLFGTRNPIGEKVKIEAKTFTVIGTSEPKGSNFDDRIYMPYTTVRDALGVKNISGIIGKAKDQEHVDLAMKQIEYALRKDLKEDEFSVLSQKDILSSVQSILGMLSIGLSAVAGISLLVGGIGIMNIMLVSVTERIREIGLRKALGATSFNIGFQFLTESVLICLAGAGIGLGLGYLAVWFAQRYVRAEVPVWANFLSFGFAILVGVVFGTYPALSASRKDPIEALRYE